MQEIAISKFKATCLGVLEKVRKTGNPVRVTRFGKPVADIVPPAVPKSRAAWLGCLRGQTEIVGDIVGPIGAFEGWTVDEDEASIGHAHLGLVRQRARKAQPRNKAPNRKR
jgi:prevent-host-death family protein